MSDCKNIEPLLVDHALGELEGLKLAHVEAHLANCERCRFAKDRVAGAFAGARAWSAEVGSVDLWRLNQRLAPYAAKPQSAFRIPLVLALAASLAAIALLANTNSAPHVEPMEPGPPAHVSRPIEPPPALALEASTPNNRLLHGAPAVARRRPAPGLKVVASEDWDGKVRTRPDGDLELVMAEGFAVLDFDHSLGKKLYVAAPDLEVEVIGTRFYVEAVRGAPTTIGVISGKVALLAKDGPQPLEAGHAVRTGKDGRFETADPQTSRSVSVHADAFLDAEKPRVAPPVVKPAPPAPTVKVEPTRPAPAPILSLLLEAEGLQKDGERDGARALYDRAVREAPSAHQRDLARLERARHGLCADVDKEIAELADTASGEIGRQASLLRCERARKSSGCEARRCLEALRASHHGAALALEIQRSLDRGDLTHATCP